MVGIDIFTGKKYEDICPSTHNMDVPNVNRKEYSLVSNEDGFLSLMDDSGECRDDLKCPDNEIGAEIQAKLDAGEEAMVSHPSRLSDCI